MGEWWILMNLSKFGTGRCLVPTTSIFIAYFPCLTIMEMVISMQTNCNKFYSPKQRNQQMVTVQKMKKMIEEVDANHDGKIDFNEFKTAMQEDLESGKLGFGKGDDDKYGGLIGPKIPDS